MGAVLAQERGFHNLDSLQGVMGAGCPGDPAFKVGGQPGYVSEPLPGVCRNVGKPGVVGVRRSPAKLGRVRTTVGAGDRGLYRYEDQGYSRGWSPTTGPGGATLVPSAWVPRSPGCGFGRRPLSQFTPSTTPPSFPGTLAALPEAATSSTTTTPPEDGDSGRALLR